MSTSGRGDRQRLAASCGLLGLALLAVNLAGLFADPAGKPPGTPAEKAVPGFHAILQPPTELLRRLEDEHPTFDLEDDTELVFRSLAHSKDRRLSFSENWLLWLSGKVYEPLGKTQDPDRIAAGGEGLCSEASIVLNALARRAGREARFVSLYGHVASEIRTEEGWRVADADFGVTFPVGLGGLEGEGGEELIRAALTPMGYPPEKIRWYVEVFRTAEDNRTSKPGVVLSPRLALAEQAAEVLKWFLPLLLLAVALLALTRSSRRLGS